MKQTNINDASVWFITLKLCNRVLCLFQLLNNIGCFLQNSQCSHSVIFAKCVAEDLSEAQHKKRQSLLFVPEVAQTAVQRKENESKKCVIMMQFVLRANILVSFKKKKILCRPQRFMWQLCCPFLWLCCFQSQLYLQAGTLAVHLCVQISRLNALTTEVQLKVKYINSH